MCKTSTTADKEERNWGRQRKAEDLLSSWETRWAHWKTCELIDNLSIGNRHFIMKMAVTKSNLLIQSWKKNTAEIYIVAWSHTFLSKEYCLRIFSMWFHIIEWLSVMNRAWHRKKPERMEQNGGLRNKLTQLHSPDTRWRYQRPLEQRQPTEQTVLRKLMSHGKEWHQSRSLLIPFKLIKDLNISTKKTSKTAWCKDRWNTWLCRHRCGF